MSDKRVTEMNREELLAHMAASHEINNIGNDESESWKAAFKLFTAHGGGPVDMNCSSCWTKVRDWMINEKY